MSTLYLVLALVHYAWLRVLNGLNLRAVSTARQRLPCDLQPRFTDSQLEHVRHYLTAHARLGATSDAADLLLACGLLFSGILPGIERLGAAAGLPPLLSGVWLFCAVGLLYGLFFLPFSWYETFRIEDRFGFNRTTTGTFWLDHVKSLLVRGLLGGGCAAVVLWLIQEWGTAWWAPVAAVLIGFQLLVMILFPRCIAPLFNRFTPLPEGDLRVQLEALARRSGFPIYDIAVMDGSRRSNRANAYFTGFGRSKRLVLFDTLLTQLTPAETAAALAHEIGHYRRHHLHKLLLLVAGLSTFLCYAASRLLSWPAFQRAFDLPDVTTARGLLVAFLFAEPFLAWLGPLLHTLQRRFEYEADSDAATISGDPQSLASALTKLTEQNLANPAPHPLHSWFHHSHPTLAERLNALRHKSHPESQIPAKSSL
jgi:STE24 endopeptidase